MDAWSHSLLLPADLRRHESFDRLELDVAGLELHALLVRSSYDDEARHDLEVLEVVHLYRHELHHGLSATAPSPCTPHPGGMGDLQDSQRAPDSF